MTLSDIRDKYREISACRVPNLEIPASAFSVVRGGVQHNVRASRACPADRTRTVVGPITVDIGIYPDATGAALWHESQSLQVEDGYYTATLGADLSGNPLDDGLFDGSTRYVGVVANPGGPLGPRQALLTTPYSVRSRTAGSTANVVPGGVVRIGTGSGTCPGGAAEGTIRYTEGVGFEGCAGSTWTTPPCC